MDRPKERGKHRIRAENEIIRRREKETRYNELWNGTVKYFDHWNKANAKFDAWTSPRYYNDNNKLLSDIKSKRDKEELLEKRRERLRKLYEDERRSLEIEMMVHKNRHWMDKPENITQEVPIDILKEVNGNLKQTEETKRRKEAEEKLFNQWRRNNPLIRQLQSKYHCKDLKLSWLDQQIEKRMQKEKEEEEMKIILKENEKKLKMVREKEELHKKELEKNKQKLKEALDEQIAELKEKQKDSDNLRLKESKELKQKILLAELDDARKLEEQRRRDREFALFNIRQHNRKLKQKAKDVQENLEKEKLLISKLKDLELEEMIEEQHKRNEIKQGIDEFVEIIKQQQALEVHRQKRLDFLFESEAKSMYDMQTELWRKEELARQQFAADVINSVKDQIDLKIKENKEKQKEILREREEMIQKIEEYNQELKRIQEQEEKKKVEMKKSREEEIVVKNVKKKQLEGLRMKELDEELERIRREEERLQQEILKMQQRQGPYRPPRNRLLL